MGSSLHKKKKKLNGLKRWLDLKRLASFADDWESGESVFFRFRSARLHPVPFLILDVRWFPIDIGAANPSFSNICIHCIAVTSGRKLFKFAATRSQRFLCLVADKTNLFFCSSVQTWFSDGALSAAATANVQQNPKKFADAYTCWHHLGWWHIKLTFFISDTRSNYTYTQQNGEKKWVFWIVVRKKTCFLSALFADSNRFLWRGALPTQTTLIIRVYIRI